MDTRGVTKAESTGASARCMASLHVLGVWWIIAVMDGLIAQGEGPTPTPTPTPCRRLAVWAWRWEVSDDAGVHLGGGID